MWNNAREIININQITCIEVVEKDENYDEWSDEERAKEDEEREKYFADVYLADRGSDPYTLSREQYNSLVSLIKKSYMWHNGDSKIGEVHAK